MDNFNIEEATSEPDGVQAQNIDIFYPSVHGDAKTYVFNLPNCKEIRIEETNLVAARVYFKFYTQLNEVLQTDVQYTKSDEFFDLSEKKCFDLKHTSQTSFALKDTYINVELLSLRDCMEVIFYLPQCRNFFIGEKGLYNFSEIFYENFPPKLVANQEDIESKNDFYKEPLRLRFVDIVVHVGIAFLIIDKIYEIFKCFTKKSNFTAM